MHSSLREDRDRRDCGEAETRARWQTYHSVLVMAVLADHPPQDGEIPILVLLPILHSACCWTDPERVCRWLADDHGVDLHPSALRRAFANPDDAWHVLWRFHLRLSVILMTSTYRLPRAVELLEGDGSVLDRLRDTEAHLDLGGSEASHTGLEDLRRARATLRQRWFGLEPRTRDCAMKYLRRVLAEMDENRLFAIPASASQAERRRAVIDS